MERKKLAIKRMRNEEYPHDWLKIAVGEMKSWGFWFQVILKDNTVEWKKMRLKRAKLYLSEFLYLSDIQRLSELE